MESFKINENLEAICEWKKTRNGFKHEAILLRNGAEVLRVKVNYLNRTWEWYTYESVLQELFEKAKNAKLLSPDDGVDFKTAIVNGGKREASVFKSVLKSTAMVAALGDVFGKDKKEANDWKARILKAGLGDLGLEMPEDWDTLDEATKEARLNAVIAQIKT